MKTSLKIKLLEYIKAQGGKHIPHYQMMLLTKQWGYRESNAERRLRECPEIGKQYESGVIKAYYWKGVETVEQMTKPDEQLTFLGTNIPYESRT